MRDLSSEATKGEGWIVTVTEDRYGGTYVSFHLGKDGCFLAWHCDAGEVPTAQSGDDTTASDFWSWVNEAGYIVGIGRTKK